MNLENHAEFAHPHGTPKINKKSLKIDPGVTPVPERLPDDLPGLILEVQGSIFYLKIVIFDTSET